MYSNSKKFSENVKIYSESHFKKTYRSKNPSNNNTLNNIRIVSEIKKTYNESRVPLRWQLSNSNSTNYQTVNIDIKSIWPYQRWKQNGREMLYNIVYIKGRALGNSAEWLSLTKQRDWQQNLSLLSYNFHYLSPKLSDVLIHGLIFPVSLLPESKVRNLR